MRIIPVVFAFLSFNAAAFEIPKGLTSADRQEVVRTIGLNSAHKVLTNPYPLGGYSGFEFGYSVEFINVRDMRQIGCQPGAPGCPNTAFVEETELRYSRLTVGKGLYNNIDAFFSFVPPAGSVNLTDYGVSVRWSFYQARFLPINISSILHFNQLNYSDSFANSNIGAELIMGVNVDNFAIYFGGGWIRAEGKFMGSSAGTCNEDCTVPDGDPEVDAISRTVSSRVQETHTVVGLSTHFENLFAAAQVDRYRDAVYSLKVGLRY